ncbi:MAG: hypothetical protein ACHQYQ_09355 [Bacteriovoracales bacterium]|jgi:hypothetical protein
MKTILSAIFLLIFSILGQAQEDCKKSKFLKTNFCIGDYIYNPGVDEANLVGQIIGMVQSPDLKYSVVTLLVSDWDLPLIKEKKLSKKGYWNVQTMDLMDIKELNIKTSFGRTRIGDFEVFKKVWDKEIKGKIQFYQGKAQENKIPIKIKYP